MGTKLIALSNYTNGPRGLQFRKGDTFEANGELYAFLMADAPGVFGEPEAAPEQPQGKTLDKPPANKAVRSPRAKK